MKLMSEKTLQTILEKAYQAGVDRLEASNTGFEHGPLQPGTVLYEDQQIVVKKLMVEASRLD